MRREEYTWYRNLVTTMIRKKHSNYYANKLNEMRGNFKSMWTAINSVINPNAEGKNLNMKLIVNDQERSDNKQVSNYFNN